MDTAMAEYQAGGQYAALSTGCSGRTVPVRAACQLWRSCSCSMWHTHTNTLPHSQSGPPVHEAQSGPAVQVLTVMLTPLTTTSPRLGMTFSISATVPLSLPATTWLGTRHMASQADSRVSRVLAGRQAAWGGMLRQAPSSTNWCHVHREQWHTTQQQPSADPQQPCNGMNAVMYALNLAGPRHTGCHT